MGIERTLSNNYKEKTVLITGHTGFKGGWLALWLESIGAKVIGYSLDPPTDPSFFVETGLSDRIVDLRGDVLDQQKLFQVVYKYHPDFIFHLAAQPLVHASYKNPLETIKINVLGTANLLESVRTSGIPTTCVCITSDKCYENREWDYSYREIDCLGGHDPYSASKGAAEIVISSYRRSFFTREQFQQTCSLSSARAGNVVGGGDWANDRLVPDCIRALETGETIQIRNPQAVRPWQFVLDPLFGYLWLAYKMQNNPGIFSDAWNFGPNPSNKVDVKMLVELMIQNWGSGKWHNISNDNVNEHHEAKTLMLDISKSVTKLCWKPIYDIETAIKRTIDWYKTCYQGGTDLYEFSLHQIEEYVDIADRQYRLDPYQPD